MPSSGGMEQTSPRPRAFAGGRGTVGDSATTRCSSEATSDGQMGMVQMRVTPGPQNQAQRTQSVSPIGLVVNGLHCAASHTHDFSPGVTLTCQLLNHAAKWTMAR